MPILLCRVDDRLIHGQVVVGWGAQLGLDFIAVVDDDLSASQWEQDLYRAGLPDSIEAMFPSVEEAADLVPVWETDDRRVFILTRDIQTMRRLAERGVLNEIEVNLGGLHAGPRRTRVLPYLFLSGEELRELQKLERSAVQVSAQDVPSAKKVALADILEQRAG